MKMVTMTSEPVVMASEKGKIHSFQKKPKKLSNPKLSPGATKPTIPKKPLQTDTAKEKRTSSIPRGRRKVPSPVNINTVSGRLSSRDSGSAPVTPRQVKKIVTRTSLTPEPSFQRRPQIKLPVAAVSAKAKRSVSMTDEPSKSIGKSAAAHLVLPETPALDVANSTAKSARAKNTRKVPTKSKTAPSTSVSDHVILPKGLERELATTAGDKTKIAKAGVNAKTVAEPAESNFIPGRKITKNANIKSVQLDSLLSLNSSATDESHELLSLRETPSKIQGQKSPNAKWWTAKQKKQVTSNEGNEIISAKDAFVFKKAFPNNKNSSLAPPKKAEEGLAATIHDSNPSKAPRRHQHRNLMLDTSNAMDRSMSSSGGGATRQRTTSMMGSIEDKGYSATQQQARLITTKVKESKQLSAQNSTSKSPDQRKTYSNTPNNFYGTPLVPLDIDETPGRKPKLNLMHHKDALKVLDQIQHMERRQLQLKVKPDTIEWPLLLRRTQTVELKSIQMLKTAGTSTSATLSMRGYKGGPQENQINQDRSFVISPFFLRNHSKSQIRRRILAVFDGHAESGAIFAEHCQKQLPLFLSEKLSEAFKKAVEEISSGIVQHQEDEVSITKRALVETFVAMEESAPKEESGGCTATVIYQQGQKVYIANAGDSRSIIAVYRKNQQFSNARNNQQYSSPSVDKNEALKKAKVVYMSREDKPDFPDERARLISCGGEIVPAEKNRSSKVRLSSGVPGIASAALAMSRSIGDLQFTVVGVIPNPRVDVVDLKDITKMELILAKDNEDVDDDVCIFAMCLSDGMMIESLADADALALEIAPSLFEDNGPHPLTACQTVITRAAQAWDKRNKGKFRDDITLAVSILRTPGDTVLL